jgi:AI-2 transport protein TqsA
MRLGDRAPPAPALWIIAIILVVASLHWMQVLALPLALALFLMALVWPVQTMIEARLPRTIALAASILLVLAATASIILLIGLGVAVVADGLDEYGPRIEDIYRSFGLWLDKQGFALWPDIADQVTPDWIFQVVQGAAARVNAAAGFLALTLVFLALGLLEVPDIRRRLPHAFGADAAAKLAAAFEEIGWKFRRYMLVRSAVSMLTGLLTWLLALLVGLDFALVWGGLAFALNYIPVIGSIAAVVPPVLFAFVQFESWQMTLLVLAGMGLIQFSIGNFLDPRIEGRALAISPFVVVASIFFWGLVWGIPGAFIGVPLTIAVVSVCRRFHAACWIARLLTPNPLPENRKGDDDERRQRDD